MPNLGYRVNTLTVTYATPVNNSANVVLANVNINVVAMSADLVVGADYSALTETMLVKGLWSGNQFIPGKQITLITASAS